MSTIDRYGWIGWVLGAPTGLINHWWLTWWPLTAEGWLVYSFVCGVIGSLCAIRYVQTTAA